MFRGGVYKISFVLFISTILQHCSSEFAYESEILKVLKTSLNGSLILLVNIWIIFIISSSIETYTKKLERNSFRLGQIINNLYLSTFINNELTNLEKFTIAINCCENLIIAINGLKICINMIELIIKLKEFINKSSFQEPPKPDSVEPPKNVYEKQKLEKIDNIELQKKLEQLKSPENIENEKVEFNNEQNIVLEQIKQQINVLRESLELEEKKYYNLKNIFYELAEHRCNSFIYSNLTEEGLRRKRINAFERMCRVEDECRRGQRHKLLILEDIKMSIQNKISIRNRYYDRYSKFLKEIALTELKFIKETLIHYLDEIKRIELELIDKKEILDTHELNEYKETSEQVKQSELREQYLIQGLNELKALEEYDDRLRIEMSDETFNKIKNTEQYKLDRQKLIFKLKEERKTHWNFNTHQFEK
jgi:hypothetical protein